MNRILLFSLFLSVTVFQIDAQSKWAYVETNTGSGVLTGIILDDGTELLGTDYEEIVFAGNNFYCKQNGLWGCIDSNGKVVLSLVYEDIGYGFSAGLFRVMHSGKWGFVDAQGTVRIDYIYDFACNFQKGKAYVKVDGKDFYIRPSGRKAGKAKEELHYCTDGLGCTAELNNQFETDSTLQVFSENGSYGVRHSDGTIVVPAEFDQIGFYFNDIITVARSGMWGAYHNDGRIVVEPGYSYMSFFNDWKGH